MLRAIMVSGLTLWAMMSSGSAAESYSIGAGVESCGQWIADFQNQSYLGIDSQHQNLEWVLGFMSAVGYKKTPQENPLNGLDAQAVNAWMTQYCQSHPLAGIYQAAEVLIQQHPK